MAHYLLSSYNFPWLLLPRQPDPGHRGDELRRAAEEGGGGGGGSLARGGGAQGEFPPPLGAAPMYYVQNCAQVDHLIYVSILCVTSPPSFQPSLLFVPLIHLRTKQITLMFDAFCRTNYTTWLQFL